MAIDYKKQWYRFMDLQGHIMTYDGNVKERLRDKMCAHINRTIEKREKLMKEYLISGMKTHITGGDKVCQNERIDFRGDTYTNIKMVKADFDAWCKKKGGK